MSTFKEIIKSRIERLNDLKDNFIDTVKIFYSNPNDNPRGVTLLSPTTRRWGSTTENHEFYQAALKKEFNEFTEYFELIKPFFPIPQKRVLIKQIPLLMDGLKK